MFIAITAGIADVTIRQLVRTLKGIKELYYKKLWKKYSIANQQLWNILHCGQLDKIMENR